MVRTFLITLFFIQNVCYATDQTTLRLVQGYPKETYKHSRLGQPYLAGVEVQIRNAGTITAEDITVTATLPGGTRQKLSGPSSIEKNMKATYSADLWIQNPPKQKVIVDFSCINCRNR